MGHCTGSLQVTGLGWVIAGFAIEYRIGSTKIKAAYSAFKKMTSYNKNDQ